MDREDPRIGPTEKSLMVYPQQATPGNANQHDLIAELPCSTLESDGSDVTSLNLAPDFPKGLFVAMSNGKIFQYYDWRDLQKKIDAAQSKR